MATFMLARSGVRSIGVLTRTTGGTAMKTFEFSVIASGLDPEASDFEARFYEAGCDDALVSFQKGHIIVDFARAAANVDEAVTTALDQVRRAGATVERVEPDPLVTLSEIAARSGLTRAAVSLYAKGERRADFPAPVACVTTDSPLWEWSQVAGWLVEQGKLDRDVLAEAVTVSRANRSLTLELIASGAVGDADMCGRRVA